MSRARRHSATSSCTWSAEEHTPEKIHSHRTSFTCWPITDRVTPRGRKGANSGTPVGLACHRSLKFVHSSFWWGCWGGSSALGLWSSDRGAVEQWGRVELQVCSVEAARLCVYIHAIGCRDERRVPLLYSNAGEVGRGGAQFKGLARSMGAVMDGDGWWRWRSRWAAAMVTSLEFIRTVGTLQM